MVTFVPRFRTVARICKHEGENVPGCINKKERRFNNIINPERKDLHDEAKSLQYSSYPESAYVR
jgi:hypothetical protein